MKIKVIGQVFVDPTSNIITQTYALGKNTPVSSFQSVFLAGTRKQ